MSAITTAEDAISKADSLIVRYYSFYRLQNVRKDGDEWVVRYDVSVIGPPKIVIIRLDAKTGNLIEYDTGE